MVEKIGIGIGDPIDGRNGRNGRKADEVWVSVSVVPWSTCPRLGLAWHITWPHGFSTNGGKCRSVHRTNEPIFEIFPASHQRLSAMPIKDFVSLVWSRCSLIASDHG